jgi:hypothetical protein
MKSKKSEKQVVVHNPNPHPGSGGNPQAGVFHFPKRKNVAGICRFFRKKDWKKAASRATLS